MTHQEFNNIYYLFTGNKKGIKPYEQLKTTGYELKEFVDFAIKKKLDTASFDQMEMGFNDY